MTKSSVPMKWVGEFDGSIMKESVTYDNGAVLEMQLSLSQVDEIDINKMMGHQVEIEIVDEDIDEEEIEDINDIYTLVEEDGKPFLIHKDVLDVYIEMLEK